MEVQQFVLFGHRTSAFRPLYGGAINFTSALSAVEPLVSNIIETFL